MRLGSGVWEWGWAVESGNETGQWSLRMGLDIPVNEAVLLQCDGHMLPVHLQRSCSSTRAATTSQPSRGGASLRATLPPSPSPSSTPEEITPRAWRCLIQ